MIRSLIGRVDAILIGGAMAYTFLRARGVEVGRSRVEEDKLELALDLMTQAARRGVAIVLPIDHVVAVSVENAIAETVDRIALDRMGLDIGPRTADEFIARLAGVKTVVWNGPLGYFELPAFAHGTLKVGEALAGMEGVFTVIGGGDTAAALSHQPWSARFSHISTGGGATLEFLEGRELPGVKALE
jgi:phosphoglycerate kinase